MPPESKPLSEGAQQSLADFLWADMDLCFTMLNTAEIASDPAHTSSALRHVSEGLLTIRKLSAGIEHLEMCGAIRERADELEKALERFQDGHDKGGN